MFSYRKLSAKEQIKIDIKAYCLAVLLYALPDLGIDFDLRGPHLTAVVVTGPFYILYQVFRIKRGA